jgi:flavin reductase (DIM6/NTAB) family NADH-FMN oxidoreductase RutF
MLIDAAGLSQTEMYKLLIGAVAPRPIAWVGSRNNAGQNNLAPYSFFNCFSSAPPIVGYSCIPRLDGRKKDSHQFVEESRCFTLNCVSHRLGQAMSKSAALLEPGENEFAYAQLEMGESVHINAPFVKAAGVIFECSLHDIISFGVGPGAGTLILGQIRHIHIDEALYNEGRIDFATLDPIGRLAGNWYSTIRDRFEMERG